MRTLIVFCLVLLAGCSEPVKRNASSSTPTITPTSPPPAANSGSTSLPTPARVIFLIDLDVIARATGGQDLMEAQLEAASKGLTDQIRDRAATIEAQLMSEREKMGASRTQTQQAQLARQALVAQKELKDLKLEAETLIAGRRLEIMDGFRERISQVATEVAKKHNGLAVIAINDNILWIDPAVDLTDEVLAELRSRENRGGATNNTNKTKDVITNPFVDEVNPGETDE